MAEYDGWGTKHPIDFQSILLLLHLFVAGGLLLVLRLGNPRFAGLYGYIATALLIFDVLYYFPRLKEFEFQLSTFRMFDARLLYTLLFLSVSVFLIAGKGVLYYLSVTTIIFVLIYSSVHTEVTLHHIIVIFVVSTNLLIGQASTGAFYFAYFDTISHTTTIAEVSQSNNLQPVEYARGNLPSLFLFGGVAVKIFSAEPRWTLGLFTAVGIQTAGLVVYTFVSRFGFSRTVGFVGYCMLVVSPSFLDFGTRVHPQTLSFILFSVFVLVSVLSDRTEGQLLLLPIIVTWLLSHQASLLIGVMLFLPISVYLSWIGNHYPLKSLFLLGVVVTSYWVVLTTLFSIIPSWLLTMNPQVNPDQARLLIPTVESPRELFRLSVPYYLSSLYRSFWLALASMGAYCFASRYGWSNRLAFLLSLCIPAGWAFFPNPTWIGIQDVLILQRWSLMALPLVVILPAIGLRVLASESSGSRGVVIGSAVALLLFTSLVTGVTDPSINEIAGEPKEIRHYMTDRDTKSIEFIQMYADGTVETSLSFAQYMGGTKIQQDSRIISITNGGRIVDSDLPVLLPNDALTDNGIQVRIRTNHDVQYLTIVNESNLRLPATRNRVYTNGGAVFYD